MPIEIFFGGIFNCIKINKLKWYLAYFLKQKVQLFGFYSKNWIKKYYISLNYS